MTWEVVITKSAAKKAKRLPKAASAALMLLWKQLEEKGPMQPDWPNFSKLKGRKSEWHCHLKKGKPTYVACWRQDPGEEGEKDGKNRKITIFYTWTHEDAPY